MLKNTFLHIPGIGIKSEHILWSSGILSWDDFLGSYPTPLSKNTRNTIRCHVEESVKHLTNKNSHYFKNLLPFKQLWRPFPEFRDAIAYLDIETTGLDNERSHITTIALYDGKSVFNYIYGINLDDFREDIRKYKVVVTYNGKCFDIPFIKSYLGIEMNHFHIDLRYILKSLGYKGGLKGCEKYLGIDRGALDGVDGFCAILLWDDFIRNKNKKALETLLAYNILDTVNLERLMITAYNLKLRDTPFSESHTLPLPSSPIIPFKADRDTIEKIKFESYRFY